MEEAWIFFRDKYNLAVQAALKKKSVICIDNSYKIYVLHV